MSQRRHLNLKARLPNAAEDDISLVSQPLFSLAQFDPQLGKALAAELLQLNTLEVLVDPFVGIEVGSVAGQLLQLYSTGRPASQEILDRPRAMYRRASPAPWR